MVALDVLKILGLGVIGLGFLLAVLAYRLLGKVHVQPSPHPSVLLSIYIFMGFSTVLCGIGFAYQVYDQSRSLKELNRSLEALQAKLDSLINSRKLLSKVRGTIDVPVHGHTVPRTFNSAGTLAGFTEGVGVHIWLAVEVDGSIWPKERHLQVSKDGKWSSKVFEDGSGSKFSLILIAADEVAHAKIEEWLVRGKSEGGKFERMNTIEGTVRLDRIDNLRLEGKP